MATQGPHEIEFTVGTDGKIVFKVRGIKGAACSDVAKAVRKATGFTVESDKTTPEWYEEAVSAVGVSVKGRA